MQPQRRSARLLLLASLAASACTEQALPTSIPDGVNAALTAAAGANNQKVKVKSMQLSANTLRIDGPSVSGSVSIGNSGLAIESNVVVRAEITQSGVSKQAVNTATQCSGAPGDVGKLPTGTCEMMFTASASNSAPGDGILTAGAATFTLHVVQTSDAGDTELASKSLLVNLVGTPSMTVTIAPTSLLIGGAPATATAVIQNPANSLQGVLVQGWIVQGAARRASGGTLVTCGSNAGVLPPGTCTLNLPVSASNAGAGVGTLVAGPATFELDLVQNSGSSSTTLDVKTAPITLTVPNPVRITGITIPATLALGAATPYTALIQNDGPSLSTVVIQASITQGTASRAAGGRQVQCGTGPIGQLPAGSCSLPADVVAFNAPNAGNGTLIPGPAMLEIDLDQAVGGITTNLDKKFIPVTLVMAGPGIIGIELSATDILIGEQINYTATLYNPTNATISAAGIQGYLTQEPIVDFGTGGTDLTCADAAQATLPPGACTVSFTLNTRNVYETPAWIPGPATFRLELIGGTTLLDSRSLNLFLYQLQ